MDKKFYFLAIVFLSVIAVYLVYNFGSSTDEGNLPPNDTFADFPVDGDSDVFSMRTQTGSIEMRNFLLDAESFPDPVNDGHFQLGNYIDPASPEPTSDLYNIEYISETQFFVVSLQQEPLASSRQAAEQFLLEFLDISESEMCQLGYSVTVPARVSVNYAGIELGFSFCSEAVQL